MINIESDTGLTQIKLLDNPFVNKWKEHLRHGTKHVPSIGFIKDSYKKTILQKYV